MASIPTKVKLLIFTQALNTLTLGYFLIYLTAYLVEINVLDAYYVGIILGVETFVLVAAGIPLGILSDRKGRKWLLILGNAPAAAFNSDLRLDPRHLTVLSRGRACRPR